MGALESPVTDDVRFPMLRRDVLDAVETLANPEYQARVWRDRQYPGDGAYEGLDMVVHALYDDAQLHNGAGEAVDDLLRDETEAGALDELMHAMDAVFAELGDADVSERKVLKASTWPGVIEAAQRALTAMRRE
jgi:hypothetical protein